MERTARSDAIWEVTCINATEGETREGGDAPSKKPRGIVPQGSGGDRGAGEARLSHHRGRYSVGAAEIEPQVGVVTVRAAIVGRAGEFVAAQCDGLHASALWLGVGGDVSC